MASKRRTKERRRLLPGAVESGLRQLLFRGYGLGIVAASCLAWASLATWSIYDPSFNNATQAAPRNVLGSWGAILADLAMQSLGLAAIVLFLPLAAWGWHLALRTVPERRRARLLLWPLSVMLLAAALSALPQPKSWPLPNGLGGILGDLFMTGALFIGVLPAAAAVLRRRASVPHRRHLALALRLRHQHLLAHRALGAALDAAERMGQCLIGRGEARRHPCWRHHQARLLVAEGRRWRRGRAGVGNRGACRGCRA